MLDPIRLIGDPVLKTPCAPVTEFNEHLIGFVNKLQDLCKEAYGIGLAASQIGVLKQVFVFDLDYRVPGLKGAMVNPRVVDSSGTATYEEGCLSIPDFFFPIERPARVTVEGQFVNGADRVVELDGLASRLFQHEIDHLNGVLFIDRIPLPDRMGAMMEVEQLMARFSSGLGSGERNRARRLLRRASGSRM